MSPSTESNESNEKQESLLETLPEEKKRDLAQAYLEGGVEAVKGRMPELGITAPADGEEIAGVYSKVDEILDGFNGLDELDDALLRAARERNVEITPEITRIDSPKELIYLVDLVASGFYDSCAFKKSFSKAVEMAIRAARETSYPPPSAFREIVRQFLGVMRFPSTAECDLSQYVRSG